MICQQAREVMHEAIDGESSAAAVHELHDHLDGCRACRAEYAQLRSIAAGLDWLARDSAAAELAPSRARRVPAVAAAALMALTAAWLSLPPAVSTREYADAPSAVAARVELSPETAASLIAVPRESTTPRVHVVWLYPIRRVDDEGSSGDAPTDDRFKRS